MRPADPGNWDSGGKTWLGAQVVELGLLRIEVPGSPATKMRNGALLTHARETHLVRND